MTKQRDWNRLSRFEQLSNIEGEVSRLVQRKIDYDSGKTEKDYTKEYYDKVEHLIYMTSMDPKNYKKMNIAVELYTELGEIRRFLDGERTADYILSYWKPYTKALSFYENKGGQAL